MVSHFLQQPHFLGNEILENKGPKTKQAKLDASEQGPATGAHVDVAKKILTARVMAELPDYKSQAQKLVSTGPATADKVSDEVEKEKRAARNRTKKEHKRARRRPSSITCATQSVRLRSRRRE